MSAGHVGGCENPVRLNRRATDTRSGEISDREVSKRCGSRREADCPSCSKLFRGDAFAVIRSGLYDANGKQQLATWVTLTAPGSNEFGETHSQRRDDAGRIRPCRCRRRHVDGDPLLGTPLSPGSYRYDQAADFNAIASRLATVTFQKMGRMLGRKLKVVRVVEFQSRGLVHVHALVLGVVTQRTLQTAVMGGINLRTGRRIKPATSAGWSWGPQCKADLITAGSGGRLGVYMTKVVAYAVKSAGEGLPSGAKHADCMAHAGEKSCSCRHPRPDCRSGNPSMERRVFVGNVGGPPEAVVLKTPYQSRPSLRPCRKHKSARRGWGFRGHILSASRSWGLTFSEARARRAGHCGAGSTPDHLIVEWRVVGRGYGPDGLRLSELDATS